MPKWKLVGSGRVGIFGGSFDPPHIGHSAICKWLFARGLVDHLFVIPCYIHPFHKDMEPFGHRITMCRLALNKLLLPIEVSDVEKGLGGVSHTLRTIEHLKRLHPGARLSLVTGDDVKAQRHEWLKFDRIRELADIIRVPRGEGSPIPNVSSTEIRRLIAARKPYAELVEVEVAVYIITKGLYHPLPSEAGS